MEEEYDTDAFVIFTIAMVSIYILLASIFLYKRLRRFFSKEPVKVEKKKELVETEEAVVENPLTAAFWINLVLVIIGVIVVGRLTVSTQSEEPEVFDPYGVLGISVGASERVIKSAYRKMAKLYHPDKPTGSVEKFRDVEKAYRILTDELARANYERYGNPDGPSSVKVGIALPSWMMEKTGSKLVMVGYLLLMVLVIPLVVYCLKSKSEKQNKPKVSQETVGGYFHLLNESTPLQSVPEVFTIADELTNVLKPREYDGDILVYLNNMCSKKDFGSTKMRKPHVSMEKVKEDPKAAAWLKGNVLLHCYLNNMEVSPFHKRDLQLLLSKAPELMQAMFEVSLYPRIKGKMASLSLTTTVIHFHQYVYQGLWVEDSPLKQLPHITDREATMNKTRNRANDLKEFLQQNPSKWKGLKQFLPSQMTDLENAVKHFPRLSVQARFEVEDEEDIFVGDTVSCIVKIVRENLLPAGVSVEDVMNGKMPEEVEEDESESAESAESAKPAKLGEEAEMMTAEEFNSMLDETAVEPTVQFEPGIVYSKHYPFKIHEHWYVVVSDPDDKYTITAASLMCTDLFSEKTLFRTGVPKEGLFTYHLHFFCPCYIGLDFTVAVSMRVKPESMKPKVVINEKDLELDKKKSLVDMLNVEMDDGWESDEEKEEESVEEEKTLSKKERQRLYHLKKKAAREVKQEEA